MDARPLPHKRVSGADAFDRVLGLLVERSVEAHTQSERAGDLYGDLKKAEKRATEYEEKLAGAAERLLEWEKAQTPLWELFEATQNYLRATNRALGRDGRPRRKPAADVAEDVWKSLARLKRAMEGASIHIDLVPF